MIPSRTQVLRLYKDLLRYGEMLTLTDKAYFKKRVRQEFNENKDTNAEDTGFFYKVVKTLCFMFERPRIAEEKKNNLKNDQQMWTQEFLRPFTPLLYPHRDKSSIDRSKVPELHERDLEEHFIKGGGPGGQKVNKSSNCVYLIHKPTGLSVKVHESRDQAQNRKIARNKLVVMLDNLINKENSVENQKAQILQEKSNKKLQKQKKLTEMKSRWKKIISEYS